MKNFFCFLMLTTTILCLFSCSDDDNANQNPGPMVVFPAEPSIAGENPMPSFFSATGFGQMNTAYIDFDDHDLGFSFVPNTIGKINAFLVKLPQMNDHVRITVWDKETATLLRTEYMDVISVNSYVTLEIKPLALQKDKEYVVSITNDDFIICKKQENGPDVTYPVAVGNITITGSIRQLSNATAMPDTYVQNSIGGICSFLFEKTE